MNDARIDTGLPDTNEARFRAVAATLAEWERLRAERPMPDRDDLDPCVLGAALEYLFVAEPVAPGVARMRLAGQHLHALLGMEPRGMPVCALFDGTARAEVASALDQVVGHGVRVLLPVRAAGLPGRAGLEGLLGLLPLADAGGRGQRVLGVLQTRGVIGPTPRRLSLAGSGRQLAPTPTHAPRPDAPQGTPRVARQPGGPVLRVIRGGRA